jgi:integrase/recombinase XerD
MNMAEIFHLREPDRVPQVLSQKEIKRILAMAPSLKAKVMLSLAYGCGMRAGEVVRLKVGNIDSDQENIRIVQSKGRKDLNVMLPSNVLGLLRAWWTERPTGQDKDVPAPERVLFRHCLTGDGCIAEKGLSRQAFLDTATVAVVS